MQERLLQPSRKHYGGLGYAKDSVLLELDDPEYASKFEAIWNEHVPGFSGKSFKKRKTEAADNMEWKQRLKKKGEQGGTTVQAAAQAIAQQPKKRKQKQEATVVGDAAALQAQAIAAYRHLKQQRTAAAGKRA